MMHAALAGLDHRKAVVPRIDMEEVGPERFCDVVAEPEAQQIDIERHHRIDVLHRQHGMPEAERAGAETGDVAAGPKWRGVDLGAPKCFEPVALGIAAWNQPAHAPRL